MSDKSMAPSGPEDGERDGILLGIARTLLENLHWGIPWFIALSILSEWCVDSIKGLLGMALDEYSLSRLLQGTSSCDSENHDWIIRKMSNDASS